MCLSYRLARISNLLILRLIPSSDIAQADQLSWESNNECKGGCEAGLDDAKH